MSVKRRPRVDLVDVPAPARAAIDAARRLDPPPDLLRSIVAEAARTPQRRSWRLRFPVGVAASAAAAVALAVLAAFVVVPQLGDIGSGATAAPSPRPPASIELHLPLSAGLAPWSADANHVWLGSPSTGTVARLDAATGELRGQLEVNAPTNDPYELVPTIDGDSVWVAGRDDRALVRIDPTTMTIAARFPIDAVAYRIAPAGTTLWVSDFDGGRVLAVDASDGSILGTVTLTRPTGIAVVGDAVWVVDYVGDLWQIDPASYSVISRSDVARGATDILATGADLLVWGIDRRLERFDTAGRAVIGTREGVTGVASLDGAVWAAVRPGTFGPAAAVVHLDGPTLEQTAVLELPGATGTDQLVASGGRLWAWVGVDGKAYVDAIRPPP